MIADGSPGDGQRGKKRKKGMTVLSRWRGYQDSLEEWKMRRTGRTYDLMTEESSGLLSTTWTSPSLSLAGSTYPAYRAWVAG